MILISMINFFIVLLFPSLYTGTLAGLVHLVLVVHLRVCQRRGQNHREGFCFSQALLLPVAPGVSRMNLSTSVSLDSEIHKNRRIGYAPGYLQDPTIAVRRARFMDELRLPSGHPLEGSCLPNMTLLRRRSRLDELFPEWLNRPQRGPSWGTPEWVAQSGTGQTQGPKRVRGFSG